MCFACVKNKFQLGVSQRNNDQINKLTTYFLELVGESMLHCKLQAVLRSFELFCKLYQHAASIKVNSFLLRVTCCSKLTTMIRARTKPDLEKSVLAIQHSAY